MIVGSIMAVLFTLGLYQTVKPERWRSKHKVFLCLSHSLASLGIESFFLCNPRSVKHQLIREKDRYFYQDDADLRKLVEQKSISHVVIWGGRSDADDRIRKEVSGLVRIVYAEAGWFPQSRHCYFSLFGTNADASFPDEGLAEHRLDRIRFTLERNRILRSMLGFKRSFSAPDFWSARKFDVGKKIFVPLQDESDMNIVLSSPVKSMSEFIAGLAGLYPGADFVVRPHPRARYEKLPDLPNVEYQDVSEDPYRNYQEYGGVVGINSTMLLQFSILGLPVVGIGEGVASGTGAYFDADWFSMPVDLGSIEYDASVSATFFDFLVRVKQLQVKRLKNPRWVRNTYLYDIFSEI